MKLEDYKLDLSTLKQIEKFINDSSYPSVLDYKINIYDYFNYRRAFLSILFGIRKNLILDVDIRPRTKFRFTELQLLETEKEFFKLHKYKSVYLIWDTNLSGINYVELRK